MLNKINDKKIFLLICYGLFIRIFLALSGDFLLVPDEVMQYLEQGHRIAYGYGLIPWEFRLNIRPFIIPYFIAFWLKLFSYFGLNQPTEYIPGIKLVFCFLSMSIPLGMYQFCKQTYSKTTGYVALFLGCSWYELIMTAHKPLSEIFSTELMFLGLYLFNHTNIRLFYAATLISCLAVAVRPHIVPVTIIILTYYYYHKPKPVIINGLTIIAISILAIGLFEYSILGVPWLSYYLYFYYNIIIGMASSYGIEPVYTYLWVFLDTSVGLFYISILYSLNPNDIKKNILPILSILIILGLHSLIAHKEYRFIYPIIPFWLIILATYLSNLISNNRPYQRTFVIISIISGLGLNGLLPTQQLTIRLINHSEMSYFKQSDSLNAYLYLSTITDKGSIIDYTCDWWCTGGYYYLHRKVPLMHTTLDPEKSSEIQHSIHSVIADASAKYIITYEQITSTQTKLIKTFGKINIYELSNNKNHVEMDNYNFNR